MKALGGVAKSCCSDIDMVSRPDRQEDEGTCQQRMDWG